MQPIDGCACTSDARPSNSLEGHLSHAVGTKDEVKRLDGRPNRGPCTSIVIHRKRCHFSVAVLVVLSSLISLGSVNFGNAKI